MRTFDPRGLSFAGLLRQLYDVTRYYDERIPEAVRDLFTIVFGLAVTACAVLLALALLTWRM